MNIDNLFNILARVAVLLFCIPAHECAHGWVADKLGDHTARLQGRLTLNPFKHFDFVGTISLVLLGFGWAKPVPVDPRNFRGNMKRGMAITALAGPVANFLMALILLLLFKVLLITSDTAESVMQVLAFMVLTNISLGVFNLIPINPLDGSRIFGLLLPDRLYLWLMKYERYTFVLLLLLLTTNVLDRPLGYVSNFILQGIDFLTSFVDVFARMILV